MTGRGRPQPFLEMVSDWLVRRAGVSRCAWFAAAVGSATAGVSRIGVASALTVAVPCVALLALGSTAPGRVPGPRRRLAHLAPMLLVCVALATGLVWGAIRVESRLGGELALAAGRSLDLRVEVTSAPTRRANGVRFFARSLGPTGKGERLLVDVAGDLSGVGGSSGRDPSTAAAAVEEGVVLDARGVVRAPETRGEGAGADDFDERSWLAREGVAAVLEARGDSVRVVGRRGGLTGLLDSTRRGARARLSAGLDVTTGSVFRGIILGDKAEIPAETLDDFRRSGIAHVLAVSGLHVGALAAGVVLVLHAVRSAPLTRMFGSAAVVVFFALVAGAGPSVVRASVMTLAALVAGVVGRGRDGWAALAFAAAVVLALDPLAVTSPGFQLSFSAVAALLAFTRRLEDRLTPWLPRWAATAGAVSIAAGVGTAPASLLTFGQVSLVGVLANPLVVPIVPVIMALGFASMIGGALFPPFSAVPNAAAGVLIGWVSAVARVMAGAPVMTPGNAAVILFGAAGAWFGWRYPDGRYAPSRSAPGGRRLRSARRKVVAAIVGTVLLASLPGVAGATYQWSVTAWNARGWPAFGEVRVLDVGEGGSVLVRSAGGTCVLIDAGPSGAGLAGQLRRLGVRKLDAVVVSHPHADHFGGLDEIVGHLEVGLFLDHVQSDAASPDSGGASRAEPRAAPWGGGEADAYVGLRERLVARGARHVIVRDDTSVALRDVTLEFDVAGEVLGLRSDGEWAPAVGEADGGRPKLSSDGLNAASVVVVVRIEGLAILVPGDAEAAILSALALSDADCIVVPHHGSRGAVSLPLLRRLSPSVAVVSVGEGNSFGHPHPDTIAALEQAGQQVFRTDQAGWVAVRPDGRGASAFVVLVENAGGQSVSGAAGRSAE